MDHSYSILKSLYWVAYPRPCPTDIDLSGIGSEAPRKNLHKRSLSCAILPQQGMNLALPNIKGHAVIGLDAVGKGLGNASKGNGILPLNWRRRGGNFTNLLFRRMLKKKKHSGLKHHYHGCGGPKFGTDRGTVWLSTTQVIVPFLINGSRPTA